MLVDLCATSSNGTYNIAFAKVVGLNTAVYWSLLINIVDRVRVKKTYDEDGFFQVDRSFIEDQTTITKRQQLECDKILEYLGLLQKKKANKIGIDLSKWVEIITGTPENLEKLKELIATKIEESKKQPKETSNNKEVILNMLKNSVDEPDEYLRSLYHDWIEVVYDKGMCKRPQVKLFEGKINEFTNQPSEKSEIIKIAISLAYKEADWAINKYQQSGKTHIAKQRTADKNSVKIFN